MTIVITRIIIHAQHRYDQHFNLNIHVLKKYIHKFYKENKRKKDYEIKCFCSLKSYWNGNKRVELEKKGMIDVGQKGRYFREKEKRNYEKWRVHVSGFDKEKIQVICMR